MESSTMSNQLLRIRFADVTDIPEIMNLVNDSTRVNFRISKPEDVEHLLINNVMSIVQLNKSEEVIGFLSLKDYPLQPSVLPSEWEQHLWKTYKAVELNSRNTIFIHMFCWIDINDSRKIVDNMIKSVFMHDPHLHHIALVKHFPKSQGLLPGNSSAEASFRRLQALIKGVSPENLPSLWIADRSEVSPRLRIRRAVEEDNDDIGPILDNYAPQLKELYGEFYISEIVANPMTRALLVCEYKEEAVGVMCLNTEINYEALEESFDLAPLAGLKHESEMDLERKPKYEEPNGEMSMRETMLSRESSRRFDESVHSICKKISWEERGDSTSGALDCYDPFPEDDIEYEIVNIDDELLKVPRQLSLVGLYSDMDFFRLLKKLNEPGDSELKIQVKVTSSPPQPTGPPRPTVMIPEKLETTRYTGTPNAFLLELFAMSPKFDERYGFDILEVAFEVFPDREYCILCLPSHHPPFPLQDHFMLVPSLNVNRRFINDTLYVAHVNSIRGTMRVRSAEQRDLYYLSALLNSTWQPRQYVVDLFEASLRSTSKISTFVLLSENQPVGIVMISTQDQAELYRAEFDIAPEPIRLGTDAVILAGAVSPLFEAHCRWYMREILRHSRYTSLFWSFQTFSVRPYGSQTGKLMSLAPDMVPLPSYSPFANITGVTYLDLFYAKSLEPVTYWTIDRPLTSFPKVDINNNIVVVGCSATGLSFIEALVMGPSSRYLNFTNVTLVSECGYSALFDCSRASLTCVPRSDKYTYRAMKRIPLTFYVDVVLGIMVKINRQHKYITLKSGNIVNYDTLVLTCGVQFQHPDYLKDSLAKDKLMATEPCQHKHMDDPKYRPDRVQLPPELPSNVMIINDVHTANVYLKKLMTMIEENRCTRRFLSPSYPVVVYGESLEVYTCLAALLELKIEPYHIMFVEPPKDDQWPRVNCFNDEKIDERVQKTIEQLGIKVYREYTMDSWSIVNNRLVSITLTSIHKHYEIDCFALFYFGKKAIDIHTFKAMNESGLVYDGGLVIGAEFETNDPHIYAAGTCTRYSRRLYADKYMHKYYYSEDIGKALAKRFLMNLDPFLMQSQDPYAAMPGYSQSLLRFLKSHSTFLQTDTFKPSMKSWEPVQKFESPLYVYATLPGPLYYLRLRKPGPDIPMEVALSMPHQGHTLETENEGNFFRMNFNVLHVFDGATCLCKTKFQPEFYIKLYGKHESYFNNLFLRNEMNMIKDLNEYVTQPWIAALYRSTFTTLIQDIYKHEIGTVYDVAKVASRSISEIQINTSDPKLAAVPCPISELCVENASNLGTLPDIIRQFIADDYFSKFFDVDSQIAEFPLECGQGVKIRAEAAAFWKTLSGNKIVMSYLSEYLHRFAVTNPQYAKPQPELSYLCHL